MKSKYVATIITLIGYAQALLEENKETRKRVDEITKVYCAKYGKENVGVEDFDTEEFELLMRTHEVKYSDIISDFTTFTVTEFVKSLVTEMRSLMEEKDEKKEGDE